MKILLKNHFENAFESLRSNRIRTSLTMVGIIIGVASITLILSLSQSVNSMLDGEKNTVTNNIALIRSGTKPPESSLLTESEHSLTTNTLTAQDYKAIEALPDTKSAPMALLHTNLTANQQTVDASKSTIIGTTEEFLDIAGLSLRDGEFTDNIQGVVIGQQLAVDLFGTEDAIGNVLKIRDQPLTVVGILKPASKDTGYLGIQFDRAALLSIDTSKQFTGGVPQIQQIVLSAPDTKVLDKSIDKSKEILKKLHQNDSDYYILTGEQIMAPTIRLISVIPNVFAIIAGISLLVGGVSIMNIMLASVAERQREVGIRKAIGATNFQIINQFLIESAIIGLIGGIIGYALGIGGAFLTGMFLPINPVIDWQTTIFTIGLSVVIGVVFGLYPAMIASSKDPIETLRY